jgi:hypothetical protein
VAQFCIGSVGGVDHAEQVAIWVGKNHKVRALWVVPLDARRAKCLQALDLSKLLLFVRRPEVEVGAVRLVEVQSRPASLTRQEKVGVGAVARTGMF